MGKLAASAKCKITKERNPMLQKSHVKLKWYNDTYMIPRGQCTLNCTYKGKAYRLLFQVVEGTHKPLLSADTCKKLGLLTVNTEHEVLTTAQFNTQNVKRPPLSYEQITSDYKDLFQGLGCLPREYHLEVDTTVAPVQHQPRKVPAPLKAELKEEITRLEKLGVLKKVTSPTPWISSMVAVKKPGKLRVCIDPKDLNKALKRSHYPMPTIDEILPSLAKAKVFSVLDAKDGFWQVKLDKSSSYLTTFWTPFGRYRWLRMPFGIATAPEEYQRRQHEAVEGLPGVEVIADDILVYGCGDTTEEATADHDKNLIRLLERARKLNLKLNKQKLRLRLSSVPYMGHLLTAEGLRPDPDKVKAILEMPNPENVQAVQRMLGFVNYLSKFLPHLSDVCEPLRRLTDKDSVWVWQSSHDESMEQIKKLVTAQPVLRYYDVNEEVTVQCDASEKGLGATLMQQGQPVAFASRTLSPTEQRYAQIEKECLAIVFGCQKFDQYLHGKNLIKIESDHKPLESIFKKPLLGAPKRLQRMMLQLQKYNLNVTYKKGSQMYIADFLSRAPLSKTQVKPETPDYEIFSIYADNAFCKELEQINFAEYLRVSDIRLQQIQHHTERDEALQSLKTTVLSGWPDQKERVPICIRDYWGFRDEITIQNGILYKGHRVIIPKTLCPEMIARIHSSHLGIDACLRKAKDVLFWPHMGPEIIEAIKDCDTCNEYLRKQTKEPLMTHKLPTLPWSKLGMDLFSLPGQDYLIIIDYYSDFWEIDAISDTTSKTIIECCKVHFSRHGIPDTVITDNGPQFVSSEFTHFSRNWEFEHLTSSPYHSQSNGKAEAAVKIAKTIIKKAKRDGKDLWKAILDWRNTPTEGTNSSPVQRLMSRRTRTLLPTAQKLLFPKVIERVVDQLTERRRKAKAFYDRGAKELPELDIGQTVRMQPSPAALDGRWRKGICLEKVAPRSYIVEADGHLYRRNRKFLRSTNETSDANASAEATPITECSDGIPDQTSPTDPEVEANVENNDTTSSPRCTRTRVIKTPARYKDFVL
uniref:Gypsy retrotransposon integrase-like protein 1 n=1 Tax=Xenopus tropicalis TaxID=8364 RepID=A0A803JLC0_XENTR